MTKSDVTKIVNINTAGQQNNTYSYQTTTVSDMYRHTNICLAALLAHELEFGNIKHSMVLIVDDIS